VFLTTTDGTGFIVLVTRNPLGTSKSRKQRGFSSTERKAFLSPMAIDPANSATPYYATYRLWRTQNEGAQWSAITGDLAKRGTASLHFCAY